MFLSLFLLACPWCGDSGLDLSFISYQEMDYTKKSGRKTSHNLVMCRVSADGETPLLSWINPENGDSISHFSKFHHVAFHPNSGRLAFWGVHHSLNNKKVALFVRDPDGKVSVVGRMDNKRAKPKVKIPFRQQSKDHANGITSRFVVEMSRTHYDDRPLPLIPTELTEQLWERMRLSVSKQLLWGENSDILMAFGDDMYVVFDLRAERAVVVFIPRYQRQIPYLSGQKALVSNRYKAYQVNWDSRVSGPHADDPRGFFSLGSQVFNAQFEPVIDLHKKIRGFWQMDIASNRGVCVYTSKYNVVNWLDLSTQEERPEPLEVRDRIHQVAISLDASRLVLVTRDYEDKQRAAHLFRVTDDDFQRIQLRLNISEVFMTPKGVIYVGEDGLTYCDYEGKKMAQFEGIKSESKFIAILNNEVVASNMPIIDEDRQKQTQPPNPFLPKIGVHIDL